MTARERFKPVFNETIMTAECVDDDGSPLLIVNTENHNFRVPMLAGSRMGFRSDLTGQQLVIGLLPPA